MLGFSPISDQPISSVPGAAGGTAYTLTADAAAFTISAQDATLLKSKLVTADAAAFTVAAQDASLLIGRVITADAAAYTIAAQDATLTYTPAGGAYTITADAAAFTWAVQDAALTFTGNASPGGGPTTGGNGRPEPWEQWGGGGWSAYDVYDPEWQKTEWQKKIPPKVVQAIERIARAKKSREQSLQMLEAALGEAENQARYAKMLTALMQSQFDSLTVLRKQQIKRHAAAREEDDAEALLMLM